MEEIILIVIVSIFIIYIIWKYNVWNIKRIKKIKKHYNRAKEWVRDPWNEGNKELLIILFIGVVWTAIFIDVGIGAYKKGKKIEKKKIVKKKDTFNALQLNALYNVIFHR